MVLALVSAIFTLPATARADDDEPVDYDERSDGPSNPTYSKFWSGERFPSDEAYQNKIEQARTLWNENKQNSRIAALELLDTATKMEPDRTEAYSWIARIARHRQVKDWVACARALDKVASLEEKPSPDEFPKLATVDQRNLEAGTCHALAGNYEQAVERFTTVISAGTASSSVAKLANQRLAETFMALGRLEEAIETLEQMFRKDRYNAGIALLLAVAYDRNEQIAKATEAHEIGRKRDPNFGTLKSIDRVYIPPEDESYFLGVAYGYDTDSRNQLFATFYFREYLHHAKDGLWARRAQKHLQDLGVHKAGSDLKIVGTAHMDQDKARKAIASRDADLQECVKSVPRTVFQVRITKLPKPAKAKPKKRNKSKKDRRRTKNKKRKRNGYGRFDDILIRPITPRAPRIRPRVEQVKAMMLIVSKPPPDSEDTQVVMRCLERVANEIEMPVPTGGERTHAYAEFRIIARDPT